jgi:phage baseplate assembly protein W
MTKTLGINFPFETPNNGDFFELTESPQQEVKANLVHLLTTKKGNRFKLPQFGTDLHLYLFDFLDSNTVGNIKDEVNTAIEKFLPQISVNEVNVTNVEESPYPEINRFGVRINVDYQIVSDNFQVSDNVSVIL